MVFIFTDSQIVMKSFLEDINNVLNSGEVPNIFDLSDQDQIVQAIRPVCQAQGIPLTKSNNDYNTASRGPRRILLHPWHGGGDVGGAETRRRSGQQGSCSGGS